MYSPDGAILPNKRPSDRSRNPLPKPSSVRSAWTLGDELGSKGNRDTSRDRVHLHFPRLEAKKISPAPKVSPHIRRPVGPPPPRKVKTFETKEEFDAHTLHIARQINKPFTHHYFVNFYSNNEGCGIPFKKWYRDTKDMLKNTPKIQQLGNHQFRVVDEDAERNGTGEKKKPRPGEAVKEATTPKSTTASGVRGTTKGIRSGAPPPKKHMDGQGVERRSTLRENVLMDAASCVKFTSEQFAAQFRTPLTELGFPNVAALLASFPELKRDENGIFSFVQMKDLQNYALKEGIRRKEKDLMNDQARVANRFSRPFSSDELRLEYHRMLGPLKTSRENFKEILKSHPQFLAQADDRFVFIRHGKVTEAIRVEDDQEKFLKNVMVTAKAMMMQKKPFTCDQFAKALCAMFKYPGVPHIQFGYARIEDVFAAVPAITQVEGGLFQLEVEEQSKKTDEVAEKTMNPKAQPLSSELQAQEREVPPTRQPQEKAEKMVFTEESIHQQKEQSEAPSADLAAQQQEPQQNADLQVPTEEPTSVVETNPPGDSAILHVHQAILSVARDLAPIFTQEAFSWLYSRRFAETSLEALGFSDVASSLAACPGIGKTGDGHFFVKFGFMGLPYLKKRFREWFNEIDGTISFERCHASFRTVYRPEMVPPELFTLTGFKELVGSLPDVVVAEDGNNFYIKRTAPDDVLSSSSTVDEDDDEEIVVLRDGTADSENYKELRRKMDHGMDNYFADAIKRGEKPDEIEKNLASLFNPRS